jgi:hypothetical protein
MFFKLNTTVPEIFKKVNDEKNVSGKLKVLEKYKHDKILRWVITIMFGDAEFSIKEIPQYTKSVMPLGATFGTLTTKHRELVSLISPSQVKPEKAKIMLAMILESVHADEAYLVERLVLGKRYIGITRPLLHQVFPEILP